MPLLGEQQLATEKAKFAQHIQRLSGSLSTTARQKLSQEFDETIQYYDDPSRLYHGASHAVDMANATESFYHGYKDALVINQKQYNALRYLAGFMHDKYQYQIDGRPLSSRLGPYIKETEAKDAFYLDQEALAKSEVAQLCLGLFGFASDKRFIKNDRTAFKGFNEFASALDSMLFAAEMKIPLKDIVVIGMAIAETVPFEPNSMQKIYERLKVLNQSHQLGLSPAEINQAAFLTQEMATQDVGGFAGFLKDDAISRLQALIIGAIQIIHEMNPQARTAACPLSKYGQGQMGLMGFYQAAIAYFFDNIFKPLQLTDDENNVTHSIPDEVQKTHIHKRTTETLENGIQYYAAKVVSVAFLRAIDLSTGSSPSDAALKDWMVGDEQLTDKNQVHLHLSKSTAADSWATVSQALYRTSTMIAG